MPLHPQSLAMLDRVHRRGLTPFHELTVEQMRHESQKMHFGFRPEAPQVAEATEIEMHRADGPSVRARYYRAAGTGNVETLPLLVWYHGGGWTVGVLGNHVWSYAGDSDRDDVSSTFLQPFLSYTTKTFTTFTLNTESTYDWEQSEWTVPINLAVAQLLKAGGQPFQLQAGIRDYAERPDGGPDWGLRFAITFLFPK